TLLHIMPSCATPSLFLFFTTPAPPASYTLSLHDALPICPGRPVAGGVPEAHRDEPRPHPAHRRASGRLRRVDRRSGEAHCPALRALRRAAGRPARAVGDAPVRA